MIPRIASMMTFLLVAAWIATAPGCSTGSEMQMEELSNRNSRLKFQNDSLYAETRRLNQQVEILVAENRILTARTGDLEARLREPKAPPKPPPPVGDMSSAYSAALEQYRTRDFSGAMQRFEQLLKEGIRDDLADNCHYWIGECLYGMGKYAEGIEHFETALGFAHSDKKDDSTIMIANSYAVMGNKQSAADWYNRLISDYPASPYLTKAQEKLSRIR